MDIISFISLLGTSLWGCRVCDWDACPSCYKKSFLSSLEVCNQAPPVIMTTNVLTFKCDICRNKSFSTERELTLHKESRGHMKLEERRKTKSNLRITRGKKKSTKQIVKEAKLAVKKAQAKEAAQQEGRSQTEKAGSSV